MLTISESMNNEYFQFFYNIVKIYLKPIKIIS